MSTPVPPPEPNQPQQPGEPQQPYQPGGTGMPSYPAPTGAPQYPGAAPQYPGSAYPTPAPTGSKTLAIVALVLSVIGCTSLVGVILGIVALVKKRGSNDTASKVMAWIAIAVGALWLVIGSIFGIGAYMLWDTCQELGNGTHYVDGVQYSCNI